MFMNLVDSRLCLEMATFRYLQKEEYASVGHGIGQSQYSTAHNSIAEIEDRHAKRGLSFKLKGKTKNSVQ